MPGELQDGVFRGRGPGPAGWTENGLAKAWGREWVSCSCCVLKVRCPCQRMGSRRNYRLGQHGSWRALQDEEGSASGQPRRVLKMWGEP